MKRLIDYHLKMWKESPLRKPLLLRGARQVGKTYAVREFAKTFEFFVEINFETMKDARKLFEHDLDPHRIIQTISALTEKSIVLGKTLVFFDEIQVVPDAIVALRYFYEIMPELHVIAAGSLLDFALERVGLPVGRVQFLYMYPVSFIEFLVATNKSMLVKTILSHVAEKEQVDVLHTRILMSLGHYMAVGGMPEAVACWVRLEDLLGCSQIPQSLVDAYRYDFIKYGKNSQIKYLDLLFSHVPQQFGKKFKYSLVGDLRKRELEPAVQLLITAGVLHTVFHTNAYGIPLGAQVDLDTFKLLFIDIALSQYMLNFKPGNWIIDPLNEFVNKGALVEAFVGQELLVYQHPARKTQLYYWRRDARGSEAEVDYVIQLGRSIIPIEVKSGKGTTLKSMHAFLKSHTESSYGVRFSMHNYSVHQEVHSYPLYAIAKVIGDVDQEVMDSLFSIL